MLASYLNVKVVIHHKHPCKHLELEQHVLDAFNYGMEVCDAEGSVVDGEIVRWQAEMNGSAQTIS